MTSSNRMDCASRKLRSHQLRKCARVAVNAKLSLRRSSQLSYRVHVFDASPDGCKIEFVEKPRLGERIWVKFDGLEPVGAVVCWTNGFIGGVRFERPIHSAVFREMILRIQS